MAEEKTYATGRRKTSVARVWLQTGSGEIKVNGQELLRYFGRETLKMVVEQPIEIVNAVGKYNIIANVKGGGLSGQAGAMRLGISRALQIINPEFRPLLKEHGLLTRGPREKERKKYGRAGRRKRFQYSKR
jgi:small subunit ribosomal protein S9